MNEKYFQRGIAKTSIIAIVGLLVIIAAVAYFNTSKDKDAMMQDESMSASSDDHMMMEDDNSAMMEGDAMMKEGSGDAMMDGDSMMKKDDSMMMQDSMMMSEYKGEVLAGTSAPLLDFNKADYDKALESGKLVVLIFHANWCPVCQAEFPEEKAAFDSLDTDKVIGLRVNYKDTETDDAENALAKEFNITIQHTKIFLKDGKQILKSPESWDKQRFLDEIKKNL